MGIILLMEEIPNNHLRCFFNPVNNGIDYQPQLVSLPDFQPSTVVSPAGEEMSGNLPTPSTGSSGGSRNGFVEG